MDDVEALLFVCIVGSKIDRPIARVGERGVVGLYRVNQSVFLSYGKVKERIHARTTKYIIKEIESELFVVSNRVCQCSEHTVSLVGMFMKVGVSGSVLHRRLPCECSRGIGTVGEIFLRPFQHHRERERGEREEDHCIGVVGILHEVVQFVGGKPSEGFRYAQDWVLQCVVVEDKILEVVVDEVGGRVVVGFYFVVDDQSLFVQFFLWE